MQSYKELVGEIERFKSTISSLWDKRVTQNHFCLTNLFIIIIHFSLSRSRFIQNSSCVLICLSLQYLILFPHLLSLSLFPFVIRVSFSRKFLTAKWTFKIKRKKRKSEAWNLIFFLVARQCTNIFRIGLTREHSPLGEGSLYTWSPVEQDWT